MAKKERSDNSSIRSAYATKKLLEPYNPWWQGEFQTLEFKRPVFHKIYKDLFSLKQMISVIGPRRIGKTTLLKQIIKELIQTNAVEPARIIYFSFDDPLMVDSYLREHFFDNLMKWADIEHKEQTVYFFLDEIQRFDRWELYLKKYYDLGFHCRFMISGSASSPIFKKSRESLLGRVKDYHLLPFSFKEFVYFHRPRDVELLSFVNKISELGEGLKRGEGVDWENIDIGQIGVGPRTFSKLSLLLNDYFVEGGFPEAWEITDIVSKQQYLFDNQVQKVIFEDLIIATEFRKPENIKRFYLSLIEQPGQEVNLEKASEKIGVSRIMLEKYLPLLEMTDLVKSLPKFSKRPFKFRRGSMKCYLVDLALRNAMLKLGAKVLENSGMLGFYAENLVFNVLRSFEGAIELSFFKEQKKEVDFIVTLGSKRYLPVELKYRESLYDISPISWFIKTYKQDCGVVVTKNLAPNEKANGLVFIPLPVFLLLF